MVELFDSY